jgi:hypothetical protein
MHLTVNHAFTSSKNDEHGKAIVYERGDKVYDAEEIKEILAGDNHKSVVRTANSK